MGLDASIYYCGFKLLRICLNFTFEVKKDEPFIQRNGMISIVLLLKVN